MSSLRNIQPAIRFIAAGSAPQVAGTSQNDSDCRYTWKSINITQINLPLNATLPFSYGNITERHSRFATSFLQEKKLWAGNGVLLIATRNRHGLRLDVHSNRDLLSTIRGQQSRQ
jgi:hypothetical protein